MMSPFVDYWRFGLSLTIPVIVAIATLTLRLGDERAQVEHTVRGVMGVEPLEVK